ncbi:nidogen-1-like [Centruroides sculpturatus]|uniref:nidogen-1-like n=1 Tax=Centruroides sculpturatus TaxID=218467 RepID=UPI000C6CEB86|nr:nidogen-1-like [Centruroides sculpturatus]
MMNQVNDNGLLSFLTEVPAFFNAQFPLTYPIIAPLYSDVDTRGTGRIYYRETRAADLLERASRDIHRHFSQSSNFQPISIFIATWDGVGHYEKGVGLVNTFQVVIVSDGEDSYAYFLYPEGGIQWIQGDGKNANLPDARAQAGFMSGDGRLYTLRGSGTDQARNFDRMSNIRQPGVWLFHIGKTESNGNVLPADLDLDPNIIELSSCANTLLPCPPTSKCVDYEEGFCCKCLNTHFGNGRNCLLKGEPQRLNGKVNGILNDFQLEDVDLHAYVVTADGRTYTAVSRAPPSIGYDMQSLTILGGVIGWLFALPGKDARNGFMTTGGAFNRTAEIKFPQSGHHVTVKEQFLGPDVFNYMKLNIEIRGSLPTIPYGSKIDIDDFEEEYTKVSNGVIRSHSSRSYRLEGNNLEVPFTVDQTISYTICEFEPQDPKLDIMRLKVTRNFIVYDDKEQIVRYAMSNKISPLTCTCILDLQLPNLVKYADLHRNQEKKPEIHLNELIEQFIHWLIEYKYLSGMDTCADIQCDPNASCIQLQNQSAVCICNEGYNGNGYICYQDEENQNTRDCRFNNDCHPFAECILNDATQQYQCQCREGYRGNGIICVDDTQSCNFAHNCHSDADCTYDSFSGNYACSCKQGFTGNGYYCVAKDCNTLNTCHPHAQCIYDHSTGEYQCQCNAGYIGDGYQCTQSDEVSCDVVNVCSVHAVCVYDSYLQKYVCQCKNGYDGDGLTCRAIDECNTVENCDKNAQCIYDTQSEHYRCVCNNGYVGNGKTCSPATGMDTCADIQCDPNASCIQLQNQSAVCICNEGYNGNGYICYQDEENQNTRDCRFNNDCHPFAECILNDATQQYQCQCREGYRGNGIICVDDTQSCNFAHNCHSDADCTYDSFSGNYACSCKQGFTGNGYYCVANEVSCDVVNVCSVHAVCVYDSYLQKYVCQCKNGYDGDGLTCRAIDECNTVENCDKNAQCIYDTQSEHYRCVCNNGYVGNGKTCSPATDATCNIVNNCDINARCIYDHVDLKYRCHCNSGYQGDGLTCQPAVVSCNIVYTCSVYAECVYDPNVQSYRCQCLQGYEGDGVTCTPIATCHENPYLCNYNAECIYTTSGYVCQCKSGYTGDGTTCNVAPRHEGNFLVFAQGMSLLQMPYNPTKQDQGKLLLMEAYQTAVGMDVDCQEGYIYWTDISHKAIRRVKYDGSESEIIFTHEVKSPEGIAVDWISRNAYWTDSVKDTIEVMKLDGMEHKILIRENLVNPRGITLHPGRGKLFWTDWNRNEPKIETSNMDGSERKVFISEDLGLPNMLTIDLERDDLCWTDAGLRRIECINVDGYRRRIIYTPAAYPFDLTIANNNIYWTDWEINFIQKVDKNGGTAEPLEIPLGGNGKLYGIVSVPYQCPQINNVCGSFNGGCNHLCLPDGKGGRTCVCPDYQEGSEIDEACNDV